MSKMKSRGFVTGDDIKVERMPWGPYEWLARADIVDTKQLLVARVRLRKGRGHGFHRHPNMEEAVYILEGRAEQWIGEESRVLGPGDVAHIPMDMVHATFNHGDGPLRYLMILGPAQFKGPALVDVSREEPWISIRENDGAAAERPRKGSSGVGRVSGRRISRTTVSRKAAHPRAAKPSSSAKADKRSRKASGAPRTRKKRK